MNGFKYFAKRKDGLGRCYSNNIDWFRDNVKKFCGSNFDFYVNGTKIDNPEEYLAMYKPITIEEKIIDMCCKIDDLEKVIATKDNEIEQLNNELLQLKSECYKKRNDNKSLRGTLKATLETSNNRHQEIKRLLERIEKLELNHKQLKDLDKTQVAISKLLKEKEDLKKWLRFCLGEEEQKPLSSISSGYELGIITTLRSVIAKIEELEKGVNND